MKFHLALRTGVNRSLPASTIPRDAFVNRAMKRTVLDTVEEHSPNLFFCHYF